MLKHKTTSLFAAVIMMVAFAATFFVNISINDHTNSVNVGFSNTAEARNWVDDLRRDIRRDIRNDTRREIKRNINDSRKEARNIARADGDPRFASRYLSDREVVALRTLKSLPVGYEVTLDVMQSETSAIRSMCRKLPEFSFVRMEKDEYGEYIGCTVYRRSVVY